MSVRCLAGVKEYGPDQFGVCSAVWEELMAEAANRTNLKLTE